MAYNYGGYSDGGAINVGEYANNAAVENCEFNNNTAASYGGAIRWMGDNGVVFNSTFYGNNASIEGGAIYGKSLLVNASRFTKNKALAYIGGAIAFVISGTVDNSSFIENFAYKGGAIHWVNYGPCLVNNSYFYKNQAVYAAGAISCNYNYTGEKYIQNCSSRTLLFLKF